MGIRSLAENPRDDRGGHPFEKGCLTNSLDGKESIVMSENIDTDKPNLKDSEK